MSPQRRVPGAPSFRPDLRARHAGARSGGHGWPGFGPPRQRRAASLTAASTTAGSIASGHDPPTHPATHQNADAQGHEKAGSRLADPPRLSRDIMMRAMAYRLQEMAH